MELLKGLIKRGLGSKSLLFGSPLCPPNFDAGAVIEHHFGGDDMVKAEK